MGKKALAVILLAGTFEPEFIAALAGKRCYSGLPNEELAGKVWDEQQHTDFINKLMSMGHVTPVEHASFTFMVEGVSRSLLAQLTRHRIASYSVQSQRYCGETADKNDGCFDFIVPKRIQELGLEATFSAQMKQVQGWYDYWVRALGGGRDAFEDARFVLPNAAETKLVFTMNARELLHFFSLRCCQQAQWEIRDMADAMLALVKPTAPTVFAKAGPACMRGACPEGERCCGKTQEVRAKYLALGGKPVENLQSAG